jgi:hypothetical protein
MSPLFRDLELPDGSVIRPAASGGDVIFDCDPGRRSGPDYFTTARIPADRLSDVIALLEEARE